MKVKVFICSPLRGQEEENKEYARRIARRAVLEGFFPLVPHIYFTQFLDDSVKEERELGMEMGMEFLKECSELWVCGSKITEGMRKEIEFWQEAFPDLPIRWIP